MTCVRLHPDRQRGPQSFLCGPDGPLVISDPDCPNAANHTPHPAGYIAHAIWADDMMETGREAQMCTGGCGKWNVWTDPA